MNKKYKNSRDEFWLEMIDGLDNERRHKRWVRFTNFMLDAMIVILVMVGVLLVLISLNN